MRASAGGCPGGASTTRRRLVVALAGIAIVAPGFARGRDETRKYRIGYLHPTSADDAGLAEMRHALAEFGYVTGRNTQLDERFANGHSDRLPVLAAELVADKVEIIVAVAPPAIRAAYAATKTIPIVMAFSGDDPVASGFAKSLSRPGGNVTGVTTVAHELAPKWIELLREAAPAARRIAVLRIPGAYAHTDQIEAMRKTIEASDIRLQIVEVRNPGDYEEAFAAMTREHAEAVILLSSPEFTEDRKRLAGLALAHRLPSIFQFREFVAAGGLMSYGPDIGDLTTLAAGYVDKILKGANPGEMPIQQPTKFLLAINQRTAAELGLTLPASLVARADEIIGG